MSGEADTRATLLGRLRRDPTDQVAWQQFVERYGRQVYRWCRHWNLSQVDAEDVNQMVLVKLADKYDGKDRWYLEALGIGATGREEAVLAAWQKDGKNKSDEVAKGLIWRLAPADSPGKTANAGGNAPFAKAPEAAR